VVPRDALVLVERRVLFMRYSQLFPKTLRQPPADEQSANAKLLSQAGFIKKHMAGVYNYLPLGLRTLEKIKKIIIEEMDAIGGQELQMTALQPKELWQETGRWETLGKDNMLQFKNRSGSEIGLAITHEEAMIDVVRGYINSYKDLPLYTYQIQNKFRDEARARFGLIRGRELLMKDLYSFDLNEKEHQKFYDIITKAYIKAFERVGLTVKVVEASGGVFTSNYSHEFQVLIPVGEDEIVYCEGCDFAQNREINKDKAGDKCPRCNSNLKVSNGIEVGNIFHYGTDYSEKMGLLVTTEKGEKIPAVMGAYGWGVSRVMGTLVEVHHDDRGIVWPESVAPFKVHLVGLDLEDQKIKEEAEKVYKRLADEGVEVLFDDRADISAGAKFADADLIGIPYRVVVSRKTEDKLEVKKRAESITEFMSLNDLIQKVS
jgi:prolyl-tRNA synthetase